MLFSRLKISIENKTYSRLFNFSKMVLPTPLCRCGRALGQYYPGFEKIRSELLANNIKKTGKDINPEMIPVAYDVEPVLGELLDKMKLRRGCCRAYMLGQRNFREIKHNLPTMK